MPVFSLTEIFHQFVHYQWHIRPEIDLEGSPMYSVLDALYTRHRMASVLTTDLCGDEPASPQFQWLCRQLQVSISI